MNFGFAWGLLLVGFAVGTAIQGLAWEAAACGLVAGLLLEQNAPGKKRQ